MHFFLQRNIIGNVWTTFEITPDWSYCVPSSAHQVFALIYIFKTLWILVEICCNKNNYTNNKTANTKAYITKTNANATVQANTDNTKLFIKSLLSVIFLNFWGMLAL